MITYFFALFPTAGEAVATYAAADEIRSMYRLRGNLTGLRRLHLTVQFVDRRPSRDSALEQALGTIGDSLSLEPMTFELNAATSFANGPASPAVLLVDRPPPALTRIATELAEAVARVPGVPAPSHPFRAHVTFLRSRDRIPSVSAIAPLPWHPAALSLVAGEPGAAAYGVLRSWPLSAA